MIEKLNNLAHATREEMKRNPFDAAHDSRHHERVLTNCQEIVEKENLKVNLDALTIAALIHDYKRGSDEERDEFVRATVRAVGLPEDFAAEVINIMSTHSYGESQATMEQMVLFDSDKLEYLRPERFESCLAAVDAGQMAEERWNWYKNAFSERIPNVRSMLHFEASRRMFDVLTQEFKECVAAEPRLAELRHLVI